MKGNDKMNDSIDFLPYGSNNLYYVKGNNGFVTEDGLFYKAGKIEYYDDVCDYYSKCLIKAIYNEDITKKYNEYRVNNKEALTGFNKLITLYPLVYFRGFEDKLELHFNDEFNLTNEQLILIEKLIILNNYNYEDIYQLDSKKIKTLKKS